MKYIVGLFKFVIKIVIAIALAIMYGIKILRYTILYKRNKFGAFAFGQFVYCVSFSYCCACVRYGLISTDSAADFYDGFLKIMNDNS